MANHDPTRFVRQLSAKLATRTRHVSMFLGAGTSRACGLPDISQLKTRVLDKLKPAHRAQFTAQLEGRNFEQALSRVRRIKALLTGDQQFDGLNATTAEELDSAVCKAVVSEVDISAANLVPARQLAVWARRASYALPLEVFTVNYDLLIEAAFDQHNVPYFDGFSGTLRARFQTELVERNPGEAPESMPSFFVRLWKLHGSANWVWGEGGQVFRLGHPATETEPAAIHPSDAKYEESRRYPFLVLQDRLRRALHLPESLTIICGYSFGDQHLNEMFYEAAASKERSEIVVFCHSDIPAELADRASMLPNMQVAGRTEAIIGGVRASWEADEKTPEEFWSEEKFALTDFAAFASYLARTNMTDTDAATKDLLAKIAELSNANASGTQAS